MLLRGVTGDLQKRLGMSTAEGKAGAVFKSTCQAEWKRGLDSDRCRRAGITSIWYFLSFAHWKCCE
jgi:hypothetical protein